MTDSNFENFISLIENEKDAMPPETLTQITTAMRKRYAEPPVQALEACLGRPLSVAKVRRGRACCLASLHGMHGGGVACDWCAASSTQKAKLSMHAVFNAYQYMQLRAVCALRVQARELLFYPDGECMGLYPRLLASPPAGAPDTHPQVQEG